jgi:hypothetical protein
VGRARRRRTRRRGALPPAKRPRIGLCGGLHRLLLGRPLHRAWPRRLRRQWERVLLMRRGRELRRRRMRGHFVVRPRQLLGLLRQHRRVPGRRHQLSLRRGGRRLCALRCLSVLQPGHLHDVPMSGLQPLLRREHLRLCGGPRCMRSRQWTLCSLSGRIHMHSGPAGKRQRKLRTGRSGFGRLRCRRRLRGARRAGVSGVQLRGARRAGRCRRPLDCACRTPPAPGSGALPGGVKNSDTHASLAGDG